MEFSYYTIITVVAIILIVGIVAYLFGDSK